MKILNLAIFFIMILHMEIKTHCNNNLSNTPEKDINIRNNFVEEKMLAVIKSIL